MKNFEKYEGLTLLSLMSKLNDNVSIVVFAHIRGHWIQLAYGPKETLIDILGLNILDSAIFECKLDRHANKWYVKIDIYREGVSVL